MNIKNVLMPLLLSVHHAEAELYKCCVCIYIYCLDEHGQMLVSKPRLSASADLTFFGLSTCRMPFTRAGVPQGQCDICVLVDMYMCVLFVFPFELENMYLLHI